MIDYIKGKIIELTPAELVLECAGIGYSILISLQTFSALEGKEEGKVYIHHYLREDDEEYYGFISKDERELFRLLIGVNGIGVTTARMMLSSLSAEEIRAAIIGEDVTRIKAVKGIGLKSAQRIIMELKDKIVKGGGEITLPLSGANNAAIEEATTALIMLGFTRANVGKAVAAVIKERPDASIETIIKLALQKL